MSRVRCCLPALVILAILSQPFVAWAQGGDGNDEEPQTVEYIVTSQTTVNLRGGPGTRYPVVGTAASGDSLLIYDSPPEVEGWLRVYRPGETDAYIADFLVERAPMRFYPADQEPILTASGRGSSVTDVFEIPRGAYRVDALVRDNSFILESIVVEGNCTDSTIFNELTWEANHLIISGLFVSNGCSVIFQTSNLNGDWEFALRDIVDEDVLSEMLLTIEDGTMINGTGRALTMPTLLPEGIWRITAVVDDTAFIMRPQVLTGGCDDLSIFNELDFESERIEASMVYRSDECIIFWETSNVEGDWGVTFEQMR